MGATRTEDLERWLGRSESRHDVVGPTPVAALAATLDRDDPAPEAGDALPPLWHWLYFLPLHRLSASGRDGHADRGGYLPPVALPRRMWAGSRVVFHRPLRVGDAMQRISRVRDVQWKEGRSGSLVFVVVRHEISVGGVIALTEEQDIVYREAPRPGHVVPAPAEYPATAAWMRAIEPDPVLLFRYSALTFNSHRIHYDRPYATGVEGYPGLVVHGPLIATMLVDLLRRHRPGAVMTRFTFRAVSPLFDVASFTVCGSPDETGGTIRLWAENARRELAMDATATLA